MPEESDEAIQKKIRQRLILKYLIFSAIIGISFLLVHLIRGVKPLPVAQSYTAFIIPVTLLSYIPFYLMWVRKAGLSGTSVIVTPIIFLCGAGLAPLAFIDMHNHLNDSVVRIESVSELRAAKSNFIAIPNITIDPPKYLHHTYHEDNTKLKEHDVTYYALIPIITNRADSLFDTWIALEYDTTFSSEQSEEDLKQQEKGFYNYCRSRVQSFQTDSVNFYDNSELDNRLTLRKTKYPIIEESIVLSPVYESFEDHTGSKNYMYIIFGVVMALVFWGITAIKED